MILNVFGCPTYTWMQLAEFSKKHGLPIGRVVETKLSLELESQALVLANLTVLYFESFELFQSWVPYLNDLEKRFVIILSISESELLEQGLPCVEQIDILDILMSSTRLSSEKLTIRTVSILERATRGYKPTLLGNLHNAFYRIKEKTSREMTSRKVYEFLANVRQTRPKTGIKLIDEILEDPRIVKFREITKKVANEPERLDYFMSKSEFDSFEVMFVLKKSGSL